MNTIISFKGQFLASEADCPPNSTSEDLIKLVKGCDGKIQLVLKERSMKVLKSKFRGALQRILWVILAMTHLWACLQCVSVYFCVNLPSASIQRKLGPHHPAEFVMLAAWVELTNHDSLLDVKVYFWDCTEFLSDSEKRKTFIDQWWF